MAMPVMVKFFTSIFTKFLNLVTNTLREIKKELLKELFIIHKIEMVARKMMLLLQSKKFPPLKFHKTEISTQQNVLKTTISQTSKGGVTLSKSLFLLQSLQARIIVISRFKGQSPLMCLKRCYQYSLGQNQTQFLVVYLIT